MGRKHIAIIKLTTFLWKILTSFTAGRCKTVQQKVINKILENDQFKTTLLPNLGVLFHFAFIKKLSLLMKKLRFGICQLLLRFGICQLFHYCRNTRKAISYVLLVVSKCCTLVYIPKQYINNSLEPRNCCI